MDGLFENRGLEIYVKLGSRGKRERGWFIYFKQVCVPLPACLHVVTQITPSLRKTSLPTDRSCIHQTIRYTKGLYGYEMVKKS